METILGIDLGTTNSVVSIIRDGDISVLEEDGRKILPSVVGLDPEGSLLVGFPAHNQWTLAPDRTVRSIKRKMGSDDTVNLGDQTYTPQEISAIILRTLKERAKRLIGQDISKAVITVPAFFNEQQREATREAGELAGLDVVRIINEPTAASLTYNTDPDKLLRLLVYDLGGGTFDVSIVQLEQGVVEVLSSHGDTQLGGDDFDQLLMDHVCDKFQEEHDIDLRQSPTSKSRVLKAVEEAKIQLSFDAYVNVEEEFIAEKAGVPLHLKIEIARSDYESLIESLLDKTLVCVDEALSDAKLKANQIDRVVLVGGASRTPLVHRMLQEQLGQPIHAEVDPDLCVSMGAAIQGGLIAGLDLGPVLVDITPHTLGVQCIGSVDGIRSHYCFAPIIERNTALPASRSEVFSTWYDGQDIVAIDVFQGEDRDVRHDEAVGGFKLEGLADVKQGNEILVRFDLDLDGILTVTAVEKATGLEEDLTIDNAMSRFRSDNHESAKARLDAAFADAEMVEGDQPQQPAAEPDDDLPPELKQTIGKANELLTQANRLLADANERDAEDMQELIGQLQAAIQARSAEDINDASAKLDDLVFYLQDAT
ncbi:MAG: Hsp70 family protein [Pirellulaceae bacterium]|nr:Hsp70 family protein [Pirellulaceae bacterium]